MRREEERPGLTAIRGVKGSGLELEEEDGDAVDDEEEGEAAPASGLRRRRGRPDLRRGLRDPFFSDEEAAWRGTDAED